MDDRISVIVPVFNVAAYLPQCIESVLQQTFRNLEVIIVDDGSTDKSGEICDRFAERDSRINVIHQSNMGAAAAKNTGLRAASGRFLAFVDSDDYLELDAFERMHAILMAEEADIVQCSYRDIFTKHSTEQCCCKVRERYNTIDYLRLYTKEWSPSLLWDKLYRRELFQNVYFETGHVVDDEFFTYQGVMNAKTIVRDPAIVYNYRKRKSSVTARPEHGQRIVMDKLDYLIPRRQRIETHFPELRDDFDKHFLYMLLWLSKDSYLTKESARRIRKVLKEVLWKCRRCGVEVTVFLKLLRIAFGRMSHLVDGRNQAKAPENVEEYFD